MNKPIYLMKKHTLHKYISLLMLFFHISIFAMSQCIPLPNKEKLVCLNKEGKMCGDTTIIITDDVYFCTQTLVYRAGYLVTCTNETLKDSITYEYENGRIKDGVYRTYSKATFWDTVGGILKLEECYLNGLANGLVIRYYDDGCIFFVGSCKDGLENGLAVGFYHDGKKRSEEMKVNGNPNGWFREWYPNGQLKSEDYYLNQYTIIGHQKSWHENGKLFWENYRDDRGCSQGELKVYDEHGNIKVILHYKDNELVKREKYGELTSKYNNWYYMTTGEKPCKAEE